MTRSLTRRLRLPLLAGCVVVIGHEAALAVGHGPAAQLSSSLRATHHGLGWVLPATALVLATVSLGAIAAWQLRTLRRRLHRLQAAPPRPDGSSYLAELRRLWPRLFALGLACFVIAENVEHLLGHDHLVGLAPLLEGQYAFSVPVFAAVAFGVAALGAVLRIRIVELAAAVVAARRARQRSPARLGPTRSAPPDLRRAVRALTRPILGRAPPLPVLH